MIVNEMLWHLPPSIWRWARHRCGYQFVNVTTNLDWFGNVTVTSVRFVKVTKNTIGVARIPRDYSVRDGFWVVFIQQLYTKLNNSKSTCLIDLKFSGKRYFHKKKIRRKFGCKTPKHVES